MRHLLPMVGGNYCPALSEFGSRNGMLARPVSDAGPDHAKRIHIAKPSNPQHRIITAQQRTELAAAFRWAARLNFHEGVANHFSVAVNDGRHAVFDEPQPIAFLAHQGL